MPRPRARPLPPLDEVVAELAPWDVEHLPARGALPDRDLASLFTFALNHAERMKRVRFPPALDPRAPSFEVEDDRLRVRVAWERLEGIADLRDVLAEAGAREASSATPVLLALDAMDADASEFELEHALYGEAVLLEFRVRAPPSRDERVARAREAGWVETLKEHNLLPGRSLHVPDDRVGLFLTLPEARHLAGVQLLLPTGHVTLELNPFVKEEVNDPDIQYWPRWGRGSAGASEWRDMLLVEGSGEDADAP